MHEHLSKAPILEAVLDVRVSEDRLLPLVDLEAFINSLANRYPVVEKDLADEGDEGSTADSPRAREQGYIASNQENTAAAQARVYGFVFNRLKPYPTWEEFRDEARTLWEQFVKCFPDLKPESIGLRYINRIELDVDPTGERRLLKAWPLPDDSPIARKPGRYFMRMDMPTVYEGIDASLMHALELTKGGEHTVLILDHNVRARGDLDQSNIWSRFETLRMVKNDLFFSVLTSYTIDLLR